MLTVFPEGEVYCFYSWAEAERQKGEYLDSKSYVGRGVGGGGVATRRDVQQPRREVAARRNFKHSNGGRGRSLPEELRGAITIAGGVVAAVGRCQNNCE